MNCNDDSPPFVALWYPLAVAIVAGRRPSAPPSGLVSALSAPPGLVSGPRAPVPGLVGALFGPAGRSGETDRLEVKKLYCNITLIG